MKIDLTLPLSEEIKKLANASEDITKYGHLGTHFDVMNKFFPLEYSETEGIVFDVSGLEEINIKDIDLNKVERGNFVGFYSGHIDKYGYGNKEYFHNTPYLSYELINALLDKGIYLIGIDFAGIRRGKEHTPADQLCADSGVFVIENMVNMSELVDKKVFFHTYPLNNTGVSGLPCRIIGDI